MHQPEPELAPLGAPPTSIALKLNPPKKQQQSVPNREEIVTTKAVTSDHNILEKKEEVIEEIADPVPQAEEEFVTSKAEFRSRPLPPIYPEQSRRSKEEGQVLVRAQVNAMGKTQSVVVSQSSGFPRLDKAALDAVLQWEFIPAKKNETPVLAWIEVPINFKLN
jgi:protein TonB